MVDREAKRAEGKGIGYDRWASMHKLKAWSKTFMYLQEHDLLSPDKLIAAVDAAGAEAREARSRYDAAAAKVTDKRQCWKRWTITATPIPLSRGVA